MSCREIRLSLPAYLHNELPDPQRASVCQHVASCPACLAALEAERGLNNALSGAAAIPEPSGDFHDRVLSAAHRSSSRRSGHGWSHTLLGGAVAAALALGVGLGVMLQSGSGVPGALPVAGPVSKPAPGPARVAPVNKTVKLAFRSAEALDNVTLTLELPPHVELASWPGRHELSWQVSLDAGENVLALPLTLLFPGSGELVARLESGAREKTFRAPIPAYPDTPTHAPTVNREETGS